MSEQNQKPIYEGKAKQIFPGPEKDQYIMHFKDSATAFNNKKKAEIDQKGILNQKISAMIFDYLKSKGVESHFIRSLNERDMLVKSVRIVPIEVVVRNIAAGSLCKRLGVPEKKKIHPPLVEFFLKNDELDDPLITQDHIQLLEIATPQDLTVIRNSALKVNSLLQQYFAKLNIILVDFKLEYGHDDQGKIVLADEITPDGCRLWDAQTMNVLDKDRFRKDLGNLTEAYQTVLDRMKKEYE